MAKTNSVSGSIKAGKLSGSFGKTTIDSRFYKPSNKTMTGSQQFRLGKMQQRTTRASNRADVRKMRYGMSKGAELARGIGEAIANVTTPWAGEQGAQKITEAHYANKTAENASLSKWNSLMDSNPDKEKGQDGESQQASTTQRGGGSVIGG